MSDSQEAFATAEERFWRDRQLRLQRVYVVFRHCVDGLWECLVSLLHRWRRRKRRLRARIPCFLLLLPFSPV